MKPGKFDVKIILKVCLTSYEGVNICQKYLYKFTWKYIIIDEAHERKVNTDILIGILSKIILIRIKSK